MPGSAALIRPATADDVPAVVDLVRAVLAEFGIRFGVGSATDEQLLDLPGSYVDRGGAFWVAIGGDGALLGTCGVFPIDRDGDTDPPRTFELRKMYLLGAARGLGLGRALLDEAVAFARARGGERLVLDTTEQMQRAIAFYEANGFVRDDAEIRGARCTRGYARRL
jgi:putative acetyltransferase